tara:strand:- start:1528 stop:2331 length:804 start_codon:yes stop_codon:yes gene_type:complete
LKSKSNFLKFSIELAKSAGKIQMSYFGKISSLNKKSSSIDLLTIADKESEIYIINKIKKKYPNHSILSEESGEINNDNEYRWVIDPLDGTTNFVHNLPIFAVSIALQKNNKTICAVVYNPAADKCFYAQKESSAYLNDQKINVSKSDNLNDSLLVTGFPYLHDERYDLSFEIFKEFYDRTRGLRRLGSAALDLCFVAMGRFDGYYEYNLYPWDICAGAFILEKSGGKVTDWDNSKLKLSGERILATNNYIHSNMINILNQDKYKLFF